MKKIVAMAFLALAVSVFAGGISSINILRSDIIGIFKIKSIVMNGKAYTAKQLEDITGISFEIDSKLYSFKSSTSTVYFVDSGFSMANTGKSLYFVDPREVQMEISADSHVMIENGISDRLFQLPPDGGYLWGALFSKNGSFRFEIGKEDLSGTIVIHLSMRLENYDGNTDLTFVLTNGKVM